MPPAAFGARRAGTTADCAFEAARVDRVMDAQVMENRSPIRADASLTATSEPRPALMSEKPYIVEDRRMVSRVKTNSITLISLIEPGETTKGCCQCCNAPPACPCCALFPCCDDPEYIVTAREASKYIVIRENSLEWNDPKIVTSEGSCCGQSLCLYRIQDQASARSRLPLSRRDGPNNSPLQPSPTLYPQVTVLYFDDPMIKDIQNRTRCCNDVRTWCCGGVGERVMINNTFCYGACARGLFPCPCVPSCCPSLLCPCMLSYNLYVKDANKAVVEIKSAHVGAKERMGLPP